MADLDGKGFAQLARAAVVGVFNSPGHEISCCFPRTIRPTTSSCVVSEFEIRDTVPKPEHGDAVSEVEHVLHVVTDQEHGSPFTLERPYQIVNFSGL